MNGSFPNHRPLGSVSSLNTFAPEKQIALTLLANGYHPVQLKRGSKVPSRKGWADHPPTEESIERDFKFVSNIGLIQGIVASDKTYAVTIDIDQDDAPLIACAEAAIGAPCPIKRGNKGFSFLVRGIGDIPSSTLHDYRSGSKKPAGDILAKGKQTVIPPSIHPSTNEPYHWRSEMTPLNTKYQELPIIDDSVIKEIRAFCRNAENPIAQLNDMTWRGVGGGGDTHDRCLEAVGSMVSDNWTDDQIFTRIRRAKREACKRAGEAYDWPAEIKVIQEWIDSARAKDFGKKQSKSKPSHGDIANIVLAEHAAIIRRDKATRDWCVYNGKFWEHGATEEVKTLIRQRLPDEQVFRSVIDGVEAVMRLYPEIGVDGDVWDNDKHYLNCPDGTYNLKTGERMEHNPAYLITKIARVSPKFEYQNTVWVKALGTWFGDDAVEIEYIQKLLGMFLTGETKDECVAMWIGKSGAGKSKMTEIMSYIMGDYAQTATDTAFLEVRYHPHQEEVARMRGKRLIFIHEVEGYLNLRRVKSIASGEGISASFKGKDSFEFKPEAKIWFVGNEAPPTKSSGREMQRRLHVYEFIRQIDSKDVDIDLKDKLRGEAAYILGWLLDGAKKYYETGLERSPHVIESTGRYFSDADIIEQWIEECCIVDSGAVTSVASLFENHDDWAQNSRVKGNLDKGRFSQRVKAKGYQLERKTLSKGAAAVRVIVGLKLRPYESHGLDGLVPGGPKF